MTCLLNKGKRFLLGKLQLLVLALCLSTQSFAVSLSNSGHGEALIIPYYGNLGGNQTLLTINSIFSSQAVKVLFYDRNGEVKLSFNLYLSASWSASISRVDGESRLYVADGSCTLPELTHERGYINVPLTSGYIEVIAMGLQYSIHSFNCDDLRQAWEEGGKWQQDGNTDMLAPKPDLSANTRVINVSQGTLYSFDAVALTNFSDIPQHTAPGINTPNLSSAHDSGTATDETRSRLCDNNACIEDSWKRPIDAVAAALLAFGFRGEYSSLRSVKAETELLLTFPLLTHYRQLPEENETESRFAISLLSASGGYITTPGLISPAPPYSFTSEINNTIAIASFNESSTEYATTKRSKILKESYKVFMPDLTVTSFPNQGSLVVVLSKTEPISLSSVDLVSNSGRVYVGLPSIAYTLQRFLNNQLVDSEGKLVQANYTNSFKLSRLIKTYEPESVQQQ